MSGNHEGEVEKFIYSTKKKDIDANASSWNKNVSVKLSNFDLKLEYIEVAADVQAAIETATGGEYAMSFDSWSCFTNTVKSESNALTQPIGSKFSSIKTFNTIFRPSTHVNNIRWRGVTSRVDPFSHKSDRRSAGSALVTTGPQPYRPGVGWQYLVGATHYPPRPVDSSQHAYEEALKSSHNVTSASQPGYLNQHNWSVSARAETPSDTSKTYLEYFPAYPSELGTYYVSQNMESQSHKSHLAESGINTLAQTVYLSMRFPPVERFTDLKYFDEKLDIIVYGTGGVKPYLYNPDLHIDTFAHYDGVVVIRNGIMNSRF